MGSNILVLGATGTIGRPLVSNLLSIGAAVKAASRSGNAVAGAEGVRFDYTDASTINQAFDGVGSVFMLVPGGTLDVVQLLTPTLDVALERGVKVVLMTVLGADASEDIPYRQLELRLEQSGNPYVILRPNWFSDNFHSYWVEGIKHGVINLPAGEGKTSFIDVRDIADSAAAALTSSAFDNQAFNLTGPQAFSYQEAAEILTNKLGTPITYTAVSDEAFVSTMTAAGVPEDYASFLASIFHPVREGWTSLVTDHVETLTGTAPRSLQKYIEDNTSLFPAGTPA